PPKKARRDRRCKAIAVPPATVIVSQRRREKGRVPGDRVARDPDGSPRGFCHETDDAGGMVVCRFACSALAFRPIAGPGTAASMDGPARATTLATARGRRREDPDG